MEKILKIKVTTFETHPEFEGRKQYQKTFTDLKEASEYYFKREEREKKSGGLLWSVIDIIHDYDF